MLERLAELTPSRVGHLFQKCWSLSSLSLHNGRSGSVQPILNTGFALLASKR